jgi:hypothetical protein
MSIEGIVMVKKVTKNRQKFTHLFFFIWAGRESGFSNTKSRFVDIKIAQN